jgi:hypothetical protein
MPWSNLLVLDIYGKESWSSLVMHYVYARHHSFFVNGKKGYKRITSKKRRSGHRQWIELDYAGPFWLDKIFLQFLGCHKTHSP